MKDEKEMNSKSLAQTAGRPPAGRAGIAPGQAKIPNPIQRHGQTPHFQIQGKKCGVHATQSEIRNPKSEIEYPTLSFCLITKNEEKFLPMCLESVKDFVDEIIVVDTGSTDSTVEIAKRYGAKIYYHPWENSFSKARNYSLKYATCDWVMWLDADEKVDKEDAHKLREVIKDNDINVICLVRYNIFNNGKSLSIGAVKNVFRNHLGIHFKGIVHNTLTPPYPVKRANIKVYHHGFNLDNDQLEKKFIRTSSLLKKQIENNPENPTPHHYLANAYLERQKIDECIKEALRAIELYEKYDRSSHLLLFTYYIISCAYRFKNDLTNSEKHSLKAIELYPEYLDPYESLTIVYFLQKDFDKFLHYAEKYLKLLRMIEDDPSNVLAIPYTTIKNAWIVHLRMAIVYYEKCNETDGEQALKMATNCADNAWDPHLSIGRYFLENGNFKLAEKFLNGGLGIDPGNKSILYYIAETYETSGSPDKAISQFKEILDLYPDEILAQYRLGLLSLNANMFDEAIDLFKKVINKDTKHLGALFNLAVIYERVNNNVQAKNTYNDILTINPEHAESLVRLGNLYLGESDYGKARECFLNTLELDKYLLEAHLALSKIYIFTSDLGECIRNCDELLKCLELPRNIAIDSVSDLSDLYVNIGKALMDQQLGTLSNFSFEISALLNPGSFK